MAVDRHTSSSPRVSPRSTEASHTQHLRQPVSTNKIQPSTTANEHSSTRISGLNIDLNPHPPRPHFKRQQRGEHPHSKPKPMGGDSGAYSYHKLSIAQFCALSLSDKIVVALFVVSLMLLLKALGGIGHVEANCATCALEKKKAMMARHVGLIVGEQETRNRGDERSLVDSWETYVEDGDEGSQDDSVGFGSPPAVNVEGASHPPNAEPELSFFLKHFNDRYDFSPLDGYDKEQEEWSMD